MSGILCKSCLEGVVIWKDPNADDAALGFDARCARTLICTSCKQEYAGLQGLGDFTKERKVSTVGKEAELEKKIQDKGLDAPRLTPDDIKKKIKGVTYTMLPSQKVVICEITLANGYTVRGESSFTPPDNFEQDVEDNIKSVTYTTLPSKKAMICEITLENGYTVCGESACVSPDNFDQEVGEEVSYENALKSAEPLEGYRLQADRPVSPTGTPEEVSYENAYQKIWPLEGYLLQEKHPVLPVMTQKEEGEEASHRGY